MLISAPVSSDGGKNLIIDRRRRREVEMQIGKRRVDLRGYLIMDLCPAVVALAKIQIPQVILSFKVPEIMFQVIGKTVECSGGMPALGLEYA
jgi:hypothetical protein